MAFGEVGRDIGPTRRVEPKFGGQRRSVAFVLEELAEPVVETS